MSLYTPVYSETEDTTVEWHDWLIWHDHSAPLDLASITDVCASAKVRAELRDATGSLVGRVDANGDYHLGGS